MEILAGVLSAVVTSGLTLIGVIYSTKKQHSTTIAEVKMEVALIKQEISQLETKQDKHNSLIERMYKAETALAVLEQKQKVADNRIDDLEKQ